MLSTQSIVESYRVCEKRSGRSWNPKLATSRLSNDSRRFPSAATLGANPMQGEDMSEAAQLETESQDSAEPRVATKLPKPTGYKILIALPKPEETTEGGILKATQTLQDEEIGSIIGMVLEIGPDCYQDKARFPNGPYCKEGDFVMMRSYSGTRFKLEGEEFRLINDDSVEAVVEDPRGIVKA